MRNFKRYAGMILFVILILLTSCQMNKQVIDGTASIAKGHMVNGTTSATNEQAASEAISTNTSQIKSNKIKYIEVKTDSKETISIERINHSIKDPNGNVIAKVYYDKPVISGKSKSKEIINKFFEEESEGWFDGSNRLTFFRENRLNKFKEVVAENYEAWGGEEIAIQPFLYTVDTGIMLQSDEVLSILQIATVQTAGPRSWYYFGSTFDLQTGELLTIDKITNNDGNSLQDIVIKFLLESQYISDSISKLELRKEIYEVQETDRWKYEYFYDGEYYYIILNQGVFSDSGCLMKWNGELDADFQASLVGYITGSDEKINEIVY